MRREGNGKSCKRPGCPRDERCRHSNRATCCHCRNLVSSNGRAARLGLAAGGKRARAGAAIPEAKRSKAPPSELSALSTPSSTLSTLSTSTLSMSTTSGPASASSGSSSSTAPGLLDAELQAFLQQANLDDELALCEFSQWHARRDWCNLVVLVGGTQFNLHKHPALFESGLLRRQARAAAAAGVSAPVLSLPVFPGGAKVFELLAVYMYTGELAFSSATFAAVHAAIRHLEMRPEIHRRARDFLTSHLADAHTSSSDVVELVRAADAVSASQPSLFQAASDEVIVACVDALATRTPQLSGAAIAELLGLPTEPFMQLMQRLLGSASRASSPTEPSDVDGMLSNLCLLAQLGQMHRSTVGADMSSREAVAAQCAAMLRQNGFLVADDRHAAGLAAPSSGETRADESDRMLWRMMLEDLELDALPVGEGDLGVSTVGASTLCQV